MAKRKSLLPFINVEQVTFSPNHYSIFNRKQCHKTESVWRNPALKSTRKQHSLERKIFNAVDGRDRGCKVCVASQMNSVPDTNSIQNSKFIDINDFVKTYAHNRILVPVKPQQSSVNPRKEKERVDSRKKRKEGNLIPLKFTKEVISSRGDLRYSSYATIEMDTLYKMENLSISNTREKGGKSKGTFKRSLVQKHKLCMPDIMKETKFTPKVEYSWKRGAEETRIGTQQIAKSTNIWENFVLGMMSKQTAQWIVNQCSSGEQRRELIRYLDEKHQIEDTEKEGTATVRKLIDITDDLVSPERKPNNGGGR